MSENYIQLLIKTHNELEKPKKVNPNIINKRKSVKISKTIDSLDNLEL